MKRQPNMICDCTTDVNADSWRFHQFVSVETEYQICTGLGMFCIVCYKYLWYDADYENMMFDLKSMNN